MGDVAATSKHPGLHSGCRIIGFYFIPFNAILFL